MKNPPPILDAVKDAYVFVNGNKTTFLKFFLPILPALMVIEPFVLFSDTQAAARDPAYYAFIMVLAVAVMTPFWTAFATGWHRAVIYGPEAQEARIANPFRLNRDERAYAGLILAIVLTWNLGLFLLLPVSNVLQSFLPPEAVRATLIGGGLSLSVLSLLFTVRISFWFPARAAGTGIPLTGAFRLSRGLTLRLLATLGAAAVPVKLVTFIYYASAGILHVHMFGGQMGTLASKLVFYLLALPTLFLDYVFAAIILTVLTRTYLWAVQNRTS